MKKKSIFSFIIIFVLLFLISCGKLEKEPDLPNSFDYKKKNSIPDKPNDATTPYNDTLIEPE